MPTFFIFSRKSKKLLKKWNRAIERNQAFIRRTYDKVQEQKFKKKLFKNLQYFFNEFNTGKTPKCVKSKGFDATHERSGDDDDHGEAVSWHSNSARDASRSLGFKHLIF